MSATGTATAPSPTAHRTAEEWVAGFAEGWRAPTGPDAFVEHFRALLAPDIRLIQPQLPTVVGHRAFAEEFVAPLFALIPDLHGEVERWAAREDGLYIELTLSGTLAGRPLSWRACDRLILCDGVAVDPQVIPLGTRLAIDYSTASQGGLHDERGKPASGHDPLPRARHR